MAGLEEEDAIPENPNRRPETHWQKEKEAREAEIAKQREKDGTGQPPPPPPSTCSPIYCASMRTHVVSTRQVATCNLAGLVSRPLPCHPAGPPIGRVGVTSEKRIASAAAKFGSGKPTTGQAAATSARGAGTSP